MSLRIRTDAGKDLLKALRAAIDDGEVSKWQYDDDGDFTYTSHDSVAWLRPLVKGPLLIFSLLGSQGVVMSSRTYAIYHARFIEMLLRHFDSYFESVQASAFSDDDDNFTTDYVPDDVPDEAASE